MTDEIKQWLTAIYIRESKLAIAEIAHVEDWIESAARRGEPWMKDLDKSGVPKRLMRLDFKGAHNAANKYFEKLNQRHMRRIEDDADTETVLAFPDGWRFVRLLTEAALRYEGAHMRHCIGGGGYDDELGGEAYAYYSLRDPSNRPHVTLEIDMPCQTVEQCQGKQNEPPRPKYRAYIMAFIENTKLRVDGFVHSWGLVQDVGGRCWEVGNLPEGLHLKGDHDFYGVELTSLPRNLRVDGDLDIHRKEILELPSGVQVMGELNLAGTHLTKLPDDLKLGGNLTLNDTDITSLPDSFIVPGNLDLSATKITTLKGDLFVGGNLVLAGCRITDVSGNVYVGRDMLVRLDEIDVDNLPDTFHVGGNIVRNTAVWVRD